MKVPCGHCGVEVDRFPSRIEHCPRTFCSPECRRADKSRQVDVACAICGKAWTVKASRASQNNAITCSPACLAELRRRNVIAKWDSSERRVTHCGHCGSEIIRKPSQLAKYPTVFCNLKCKNAALVGAKRPEQVTGQWLPCEACGEDTWRTPATRKEHVFCSRACNNGTAPRSLRPHKSGENSHFWKGGSSLLPYTPGFTPALKRQVLERDGNACRACGASRQDVLLHAHHIDGGKEDHDLANLMSLCGSCHRNVHLGKIPLPPMP